MEIVPSEDLRGISIEKRNCRFEDEAENMEIFQSYSQSACEFEFKIKHGSFTDQFTQKLMGNNKHLGC